MYPLCRASIPRPPSSSQPLGQPHVFQSTLSDLHRKFDQLVGAPYDPPVPAPDRANTGCPSLRLAFKAAQAERRFVCDLPMFAMCQLTSGSIEQLQAVDSRNGERRLQHAQDRAEPFVEGLRCLACRCDARGDAGVGRVFQAIRDARLHRV